MPRTLDNIRQLQGRKQKKNVNTAKKTELILSAFLKSDPLTRKEVSQKTCLKKSYSDSDPITIPMRLLVQDNILVCTGKIREILDKGSDVKILGRGRPSVQWGIKRDLQTLKKIYTGYPNLRNILRTTGWVYDVIVHEGLGLREMDNVRDQDISYLRDMLHFSPSFFKLCLTSPSIQQTALHWSSIRNNWNSKPLRRLTKRPIKSLQHSPFPFHAYLDLFIFCLFSDEISGKSTFKEYKTLQTLQEIWLEKERNMKKWDRDRIKRATMIDTVRQVVNRSSDEPNLMESLEEQISRYDTEEKEYNKMESNMLSGKHELTPDMVDASIQRREGIMSEIIELLELEGVFTPS